MAYVTKHTETQAAAKWWVDQLRNGTALDLGDEFQSGVLSLHSRSVHIPPDVLDQLEKVLTFSILDMIDAVGWDDSNPQKGSIDRRIMVDIAPPPVLAQPFRLVTGKDAPQPYFPVKTTMWIDPGSVRVLHGATAKEELVLYKR